MKKFFVLFLCLLALFVIVSCKAEPEQEVTPTPGPKATDQDVLEGRAFYRLTATVGDKKRFCLQYYDPEEGTFDAGNGDVFSLKYRSAHEIDCFFLRDSSQKSYLPEAAKNHQILATDDPYVTGPDEDGWYTLTFTFSEYGSPMAGIRIELADYIDPVIKFVKGEYIDIKDVTFNGEKLTIEEDMETDAEQSNHGIWNNDDHTHPELSIVFND